MARRVSYVVESRAMFIMGLIVLTLWIAPVTRLVYKPVKVEIMGTEVTMYRVFPMDRFGFDRPRLSFVETVRPLTVAYNNGNSCTDAAGPFRYSRATEVGEWSIEWAEDCLSDPKGYIWSAEWTWHIGGLHVGPVSLSHTVLKTKPPQPHERVD